VALVLLKNQQKRATLNCRWARR